MNDNKKTKLCLVVALVLPVLACGQCQIGAAGGHGSVAQSQSQTVTISQDLTCMVISFGFLAIMGLLCLLGAGGLGNGQ